MVLVFFFFQAEDGIRVLYVTGVQTCALPIYARLILINRGEMPVLGDQTKPFGSFVGGNVVNTAQRKTMARVATKSLFQREIEKIGRASCTERVQSSVKAHSCKSKERQRHVYS